MENKDKKSQLIAIGLVSMGLCLFVSSSLQYKNTSFFEILFYTRILLVLVGFSLSALISLNVIKIKNTDLYFFLLCLVMQSLHGVIEGSTSVSFYSFVGVWLMLSSMILRLTKSQWFRYIFPIQICAFAVPLFFKESFYFSSVSIFVDSFSLPIAGLVMGFIISNLNSERFEVLVKNIELQNQLTIAFKKNLLKEIEITSQVAHDIRSPLAALNATISNLQSIPEQQRITLRAASNRINDIANNLLTRSKLKTSDKVATINEISKNEALPMKLQVELLPAILDTIVSEKRVQYRDKMQVDIEADFKNAYGAFANVNSIELSRVISNIINNSVEAFPNGQGKFTLSVIKKPNHVQIIAEDNGKGIPKHILDKLGQMGVSHGKDGTQSGNGLGVYHAKMTIEKFGGQFEIISTEDVGTKITMTIPAASAPKWFVKKIVLTENSQIISLDDDLSIHNIWKGRYQSLGPDISQLSHLTFTSGIEFKDWVNNQPVSQSKNIQKRIYLIDYELLNQKQTGLDIIAELGIANQSILVTSRYEEIDIRERCEKLGIQLIPKGMAGLVPIMVQQPLKRPDAILIDDDPLMGYVWTETAKSNNKQLQWFNDPELFYLIADQYDRQTHIYIDVSLGKNVKGQDVAINLSHLGFTNLHLTTGYEADSINKPSVIKSVIGKDCPL